YAGTLNALGHVATGEVQVCVIERCNVFEAGRLFLIVDILRCRDRDLIEALGRKLLPEQHQFLWRVIRQRPNEKSVDQTEDRSARADAKRNREDGNGGEAGRFGQLTECEAEMVHGKAFIRRAMLELDRPAWRGERAANTRAARQMQAKQWR